MKKLLSAILAAVMLLSFAATSVLANGLLPFTDVKDKAWYTPAVLTMYMSQIMEGKSEGKFEPMSPMTRAEFVTVLYRLSEEAFWGSDSLTFKDTKKSAWYADAVAWAVNRGLATGYPDNTFKPNAPVLRQELAKMMVAFLQYMNITKKGEPLIDSFADSTRFPDWAAEYIESLRETGLMGGDDAGKFKPRAKANRAEIATVLTRLMPLMETEKDEGNTGGGSTDFVPAPAPDGFELYSEEEAKYPYYIRFPDGYSESEKYPLVIYAAGSADTSISSVGAIFPKEDSPTYDCIVMIPALATNRDLENCADLYSYVTDKYAVDTERVYIISTGENDGNFFTWKMLEKSPEIISAVLFVHGGISALSHKGVLDENYVLEGFIFDRISEEAHENLKTLPIYYHHCTDENQYPGYYLEADYGKNFVTATNAAGMTKVTVVIDDGYGTIYNDFAVRNNGAAFDWLFAQRRETR
ncbi:MAG: S-layer homology domain-containing protein [Clostridia bacterium]|nr:S-layer homology domain-containing protein [Clostridia bacterium]